MYDGRQCIEERDANSAGTVLRKYVYGSPYIDELACKIEIDGGETRMYYLQDANFNVVGLADANGTDDLRQHNEVNEIAVPDSGGGLARTYGGTQRHIEYDAGRRRRKQITPLGRPTLASKNKRRRQCMAKQIHAKQLEPRLIALASGFRYS